MKFKSLEKCIAKKCKSLKCKIDNQNIEIIYNLDKCINDKKMCDCLIVCKNSKIVLVEILCGKLTNSEFEEKIIQLQNCIDVAENGIEVEISKVILLYETIDEEKRKNGALKKKLLNKRISKYKLLSVQNKNFDGVVC